MKTKFTIGLSWAFLSFLTLSFAQEKIAEFTLDQSSMVGSVLMDNTGNGHNAYIDGNYFFDPDRNNLEGGAINLGYYYDNTISINTEDHAAPIENIGELSISFWIFRLENEVPQFCTSGCKRFFRIIDDAGISYDLELNDNHRVVFTSRENGVDLTTSLVSTTPIFDHIWYHIGLSVDEATQTIKLYINGQVEDELEISSLQVPQNPSILIGEGAEDVESILSFCMDDLVFYRDILTNEQFEEQYQSISTSVQALNTDTPLMVFPNPVKGERLFWQSTLNVVGGAVFTITGQLVQTFENQPNYINLATVKPGTYILKLNDEDGRATFRKFIRQ